MSIEGELNVIVREVSEAIRKLEEVSPRRDNPESEPDRLTTLRRIGSSEYMIHGDRADEPDWKLRI